MPVRIKTKVLGVREVKKALAQLVPKEVRKETRKAIEEAGKIVLATEKATLTARRTGSLRKALGRKTVARRDGDGYTAVIGPRRDPTPKRIEQSEKDVAAGKRKRALKGGKYKRSVKFQGRLILVNPANYAHLVEFGRSAVKPKDKKVLSDGGTFYGKSVAAASAKPFRKPALIQSRAAVERVLEKRVAAAIAAFNGRR